MVNDLWSVTSGRCPVTGRSVTGGSIFLSTGLMAGGWLNGGRMTGGSGLTLLWVQVPLELMGLPPGSRAMWGSVPIKFYSSDESDMAYDLFFFLAMKHFLEV